MLPLQTDLAMFFTTSIDEKWREYVVSHCLRGESVLWAAQIGI